MPHTCVEYEKITHGKRAVALSLIAPRRWSTPIRRPASILCPVAHDRHFRIAMKQASEPCLDPDEWAAAATPKNGSWWVARADWLANHSTPERVSSPSMGAVAKGYPPIENAPGSYVLQR